MNQQQSQSSTPRRNNSEFSIDAQPVESESTMNLQIAYSWLTIALLIVILFNCFLTLLLSSFAFNLSFRIPILFLSIGHLLYLIKICISYHKIATNQECCFELMWGIGLISYYSCLIYFVDNNDLQMQYLAMFLVLMTIIWVIKSIFQQYRRNTQDHQQKLIIVLIRFCFVAQLMFINLKLIDWLSARWIYTFSIFWLFLLIVIMMQLGFLFKLSIIINQYFNSTADQKPILIVQIVGYIWTNLIIFGFCGVPSYALYKLSFYLEQNMDHDYVLAIIISVFYTLIFMVYTIYHKDMLSTFILRILELQIQQQTVREPDIISFPSSRNQKKFVNTFRDNILNDFPKQLIKISSTYYLPEDQRNQTEINSAGLNNKSPTLTDVAQHDGTLKQCFNCFQQQSCTVYIPCGHGGVCSKCAFDWFQERKECLICRSQIQAILKIVQTDDQRVKVVDIIALN
ncbi:unnamed protein product (macronuclear) [Paramecium tetraurelia]|uniref:RING-type domain-containing protein n=1 Tax=Paramecium tetraurelia TaxID=5888 RepID=A0E266_PARTE|nr:uncharacterized protein GSPATT00022555001 [Paramecium tetraurelia]CAK89383.1 unnamed protein product [Paramecium tetraurelia]|eukprot:XP_001456780.1 hypothetical protein (macronuclear) [Paramecium tetraurelia strain d4-2]